MAFHRQSEWHSWVRWAECDPAGIIYHARVFDWFSEGRIIWLRDHGLDYYEVLRPSGIELLVKSAHASFHHALRPGDPITLDIQLKSVTPTRASFHYRVLAPPHDGVVPAMEGMTDHAFVVAGRARRLDRVAMDIFQQFDRNV